MFVLDAVFKQNPLWLPLGYFLFQYPVTLIVISCLLLDKFAKFDELV